MMTTILMPSPTLGPRGVGLSGPIGATVDGTTATGTVGTMWPSIDLPSLPGLPAGMMWLDVVIAVLIACGGMIVLAHARRW